MALQLRERIEKMGLNEIKNLLHNYRTGHQIEETTHSMGENICQLYI
jgi:hypothetical protein